MAYLTIEELQSHIYEEVLDEISRGNDVLIENAIDSAIEEARGYLVQRYDADAVFAATGSNRNPALLNYVKDIAAWHFCILANPNVDLALRQARFERAVQWLKDVQKGAANPQLPIPQLGPDGNRHETGVQWQSNAKRNNQW